MQFFIMIYFGDPVFIFYYNKTSMCKFIAWNKIIYMLKFLKGNYLLIIVLMQDYA